MICQCCKKKFFKDEYYKTAKAIMVKNDGTTVSVAFTFHEECYSEGVNSLINRPVKFIFLR